MGAERLAIVASEMGRWQEVASGSVNANVHVSLACGTELRAFAGQKVSVLVLVDPHMCRDPDDVCADAGRDGGERKGNLLHQRCVAFGLPSEGETAATVVAV